MLKENRLDRGIRLFDNPILDWMSRVHPLLPVSFWLPVSAVFFWLAVSSVQPALYTPIPWYVALALVLGGYVVWCFSEYWIHRSFFHYQPKTGWIKRLFYYVHEHHHRYQEKDRLLAPPLMALPIFLFFCGVFYLAIGTWAGLAPAFAVMTGFIIGYLIYDYIHLYTHFVKPTSKLGKMLRRLHLQHHFARPDRWYGISCPWVDYIFGTASRRGEKSLNSKNNREQADHHYFGDDFLPPKVLEWEKQHGGQPGSEWTDDEPDEAATGEPEPAATTASADAPEPAAASKSD